jgi:signal transduction histidine kinase
VIDRQPVRHLVSSVVLRTRKAAPKYTNLSRTFPRFSDPDVDPHNQAGFNILDNAIKYSPQGGLIVTRGETRRDDVVVSISDQGVGISPEDLIPLFEKYFRVKAPTGYHVAGTGLGLPVARAIVESHGGRIWAESKVEHGTSLYFSLPLGGLSSMPDE